MNNTAGSRVVPNLSLINVGKNAQPTLVDLDGDGILDVLVNAANATGATWNFYASRTQHRASTFAMFNSATSLAFSDIDGDGDADAVGVAANGSLLYFRNDGQGRFTNSTGDANPFSKLSVGIGAQLTFASNTLIATNTNGTIQQFSYRTVIGSEGSRQNTLGGNSIAIYRPPIVFKEWQAVGSFDFVGVNLGPNARPAFVDFDGDGDLDIVVGGADGKIRYYESFKGKFYQMREQFNPFNRINSINRSNASPTIVDIDGNGTLDLIIGKGDGTIEQQRDMVAQFYRPVPKLPIFRLKPGTSEFSYNNGWSSFQNTPRQMADIDGDGDADIVGFGYGGVYVAKSNRDGTFSSSYLATSEFGLGHHWANFERAPRFMADVNKDGKADIIGFGWDGVYVSLANAQGKFNPSYKATHEFSVNAKWTSFEYRPRQVADMNGDGYVDLIGFGTDGTYVCFGQADGKFSNAKFATFEFSWDNGWRGFDRFPRQMADVNGDGRADIVGFGDGGTYVSLGQANGTFARSILATSWFGNGEKQWPSFGRYPRQLGDINGDGRADIVGFGEAVYVALGQLDGTFIVPHQYDSFKNFSYKAGGWSSFEAYPRQVADVTGDGLADIVGFGREAVLVGLNHTPQIPKNADLLFELDFKSSGQSVWGTSKRNYSYRDSKSYTWNPSFPALSMDTGAFSGSVKANVSAGLAVSYGYDLDLGGINAELPIQTWFDLPEQIQAGQTITFKSGYQLKETANFLTTNPHLKAFLDLQPKFALKNAAIKVGGLGHDYTWHLPNVETDFTLLSIEADTTTGVKMSGALQKLNEAQQRINEMTTGSLISEANLLDITLAGSNSGTQGKVQNSTTLFGRSETKLLQANLDLDYLTAQILRQFPKTKQYGDLLARIEGSTSKTIGDLLNVEASASWNLLDFEFRNQVSLQSNLTLLVNNLTGVLTSEDGRQQNFRVGEDLTFNVGADVNGDGFININAAVNLQASVQNNSFLNYQGAIDVTVLQASGEISTPVKSVSGSAGPFHRESILLPGLNYHIPISDSTFALGGLNSQSFSFAIAVGNRA